MKSRALSFVALIGLLALAGCKDKDDPAGPEPSTCFDDPDAVVAALVTSYGARNLAHYRDDLLAPAYGWVLEPQTIDDLDLPYEVLTRAQEAAIATAMFGGGPNGDGRALTAVEVLTFQPQGAWQAVADDDPYFGHVAGAFMRSYEVALLFSLGDDQCYDVQGSQLIYVTGDFCHLLGQVDFTGVVGKIDGQDPSGVDVASWSDVKMMWR